MRMSAGKGLTRVFGEHGSAVEFLVGMRLKKYSGPDSEGRRGARVTSCKSPKLRLHSRAG